jgi:hypothetical protein
VASNNQLGPLLLRQSIFSRQMDYQEINVTERLCADPPLRHVVDSWAIQSEQQATSTIKMGRFQTEKHRTQCNLATFLNLSGQWTDTDHRRKGSTPARDAASFATAVRMPTFSAMTTGCSTGAKLCARIVGQSQRLHEERTRRRLMTSARTSCGR